MTFRNPFKEPRAMVPLAMMFLVVAILVGHDWNDRVRGLLYGLSIGIGLVAVWLGVLERRRRKN
jgi:hypothetical protein